MTDPNPYEPPRMASMADFKDGSSTIAELEQRVAQLEARLAKSWFVAPNIFRRIFAVWGYFLMGYAIVLAVVMPIMLLIEWLYR